MSKKFELKHVTPAILRREAKLLNSFELALLQSITNGASTPKVIKNKSSKKPQYQLDFK